jgi:hypothetical protein
MTLQSSSRESYGHNPPPLGLPFAFIPSNVKKVGNLIPWSGDVSFFFIPQW